MCVIYIMYRQTNRWIAMVWMDGWMNRRIYVVASHRDITETHTHTECHMKTHHRTVSESKIKLVINHFVLDFGTSR